MNKLKENKKYLIICGVAAAVVLIAVIAIFIFPKKNSENPVVETVAVAPEPTPTPEPAPVLEPSPEAVSNPIDFAYWQQRNPDVYAYILIPNTRISYPILQSATDKDYYLTHTIDGAVETAASIYSENYNSKDFTDPNTVIYGHNMRNGTMFKDLHKYEDLNFFNSHRTIYIYTPTQVLEYRVFAAYTTDTRYLMLTYNFNDEGIFTTYLNEILQGGNSLMQKGNIDLGMNLNSSNKLITLQTCTGNSDTRLLVQAVLVKVSGEPDIVVPSSLVLTSDGIAR